MHNPERVCELITKYVVERGLKPGDRLSTEAELAEQFGVSKAVMRDAVHRLRGSGLLESRRRGGMYVAKGHLFEVLRHRLTAVLNCAEGLRDLYALRAMLEVGVAPSVVGRLSRPELGAMEELIEKMGRSKNSAEFKKFDYEFHVVIFEHAGNRIIRDLGELVTRLFISSSDGHAPMTPLRRRDLTYKHRQIFEALVDRDAQALVHAINRHYAGNDLKELMVQFERFELPRGEAES